MIVPMMMVQTIWEELKYGAKSRLAPSSTAITDIPAKNSVKYRYHFRERIPGLCFFCSMTCSFLLSIVCHSVFMQIHYTIFFLDRKEQKQDRRISAVLGMSVRRSLLRLIIVFNI